MKTNPNNYDAWFDYLRLMESEADPDTVREVYDTRRGKAFMETIHLPVDQLCAVRRTSGQGLFYFCSCWPTQM